MTTASKLSILRMCVRYLYSSFTLLNLAYQVYSNGLSEVILGNAIKKFNLPREELVVMTKVGFAMSVICP